MKWISTKNAVVFLLALAFGIHPVASFADNQTNDLTPILPATELPFRVTIEKVDFELPQGLHSGVFGEYRGLWILIAGRTNGLHGFGSDPFPIIAQNSTIYVVNPRTGQVFSRSLYDPGSGLNQQQIDSLSVTSPQAYQEGDTLYMTGGYGIDTATATFGTKPILTAIYLPGIVKWVTEPSVSYYSVLGNISQLSHPSFQITGGKMAKLGNLTQLFFGQNFTGEYSPGSNGEYSEQVRQFYINAVNGQFSVNVVPSKPLTADPNFRRRDLNVVPALFQGKNSLTNGFIAYAGVFTPSGGVWNVPVEINETSATMADASLPSTFKQGMNHYVCATASLYSRRYASMFHIFFGGISFGYYSNGVFQTDSEIPFINQVTTIRRDKFGIYTQYLMDSEYPVIPSTGANPGNPLLFGAGAYFIPGSILRYANNIISLDAIQKPTIIGYIVGGIQSTLPNTNTMADSSGSPYIFKVTLYPR